MSGQTKIPDEYLGDGVYASFDGFQIWLDLRAQDSTTRIALDPSVFAHLLKYAKACPRYATDRFEEGYWRALDDFGIWRDGVQKIGAMERPIREVFREKFGRDPG